MNQTLSYVALALFVSAAFACGGENADSTVADDVAEIRMSELGLDAEETSASIGPNATGTWTRISVESCFDICGSSCSFRCPAPSCPTPPSGSCTRPNYCWSPRGAFVDLWACF